MLAWASAFVVIRGVAPEVGGGALALGRLVVGVVALSILVLVQRRWVWPTRSDWVRLVIYGVGWFGAYNVALNLAEQTLDAGTTAMIVNIGPILIALGAGLFLGEGIPRWLAIGAGVAFLGVMLIGVGTSARSTRVVPSTSSACCGAWRPRSPMRSACWRRSRWRVGCRRVRSP